VEVSSHHFDIWRARKGDTTIFGFYHHSWSSASSSWWTSTRSLFPSLSSREGGYFPLQSGTVTMSRWPHRCHNSCAGEPAPAYRGYDHFSTASSGHRRRIASGAPAAQQPASVRSVALSGRAVASRRRPARRCRHQHTTSREAAPAICVAVVCSVSGVRAIRGASTPSAAKCTPSWWRRQTHRHRAPPREASRYQGSQHRERLRLTSASVWGPSRTRATPLNSPGVLGGCMALAPHLRMVVSPHKFWPQLLEKYDGTVNPAEFL
jgi:hypothetical protein